MSVRVAGVSVHLPPNRLSTAQVEDRITRFSAASSGFSPPTGLIRRLTGIEFRHVMDDDDQASDLAARAALKLLADTGTAAGSIDLLIFASASQDMVEPATAHIVASKIGVSCPVMDVKNACNSVLNAIEVADALIQAGRYQSVLITCGESPSRAIRWDVADLAQFASSFPGYTLSDAGAAILLTNDGPGDGSAILGSAFSADSSQWAVGTLAGGGSANPRDPEASYFSMDGAALRAAFLSLGPDLLLDKMSELGLSWRDMAAVCVHQVSMPYLADFTSGAGVDADLLVPTLPQCGNVASASLPLQLVTAMEMGRLGPGDLVALVGLAGGVSMGIMVIRL